MLLQIFKELKLVTHCREYTTTDTFDYLFSMFICLLGSALRCYSCRPNTNLTSPEKPSCLPKPETCENETHCLSLRRKKQDGSELTYKACAVDTTCVSAHYACLKIFNSSQVDHEVCHAHCCDGDLCNLKVHKGENYSTSKQTGHGNSVVPLTTLITSLLLYLFSA